MLRLARFIAAAAAVALAAPGFAHEFWIQPLPWRPGVNEPVKFDLRIGDDLPGESFPRKGTIIERFEIVGPDGKMTPVVGREAQAPAGLARPSTPGLHIVGYRSKPSAVELDAAKFEKYLHEKGLERITAIRSAAGQGAAPGREMFSRCAKCLVRVGESGDQPGFDRELGFTLEIVPEVDPTRATAGGSVRSRLLYKGKPCAGALVLAKSLSDGKSAMTTRTGPDGRFEFTLPKAGQWLFAAVEMVKAPDGVEINGVKPEWESLWASLTFQTGDAEQGAHR